MTKLLLVVGMPGCGKGEVVTIAEDMGYTPLVMGDIVREEALKRGRDIKDSGLIAQQLRMELGNSAIAQLSIPKLKDKNNCIIDGIRGYSEVMEFKKHFDTKVIAIHSSPHKRFERLRNRGRGDDPLHFEEFQERDHRELGFGIGDAIALSDIMIINEDGLDEYRESILRTLRMLGKNEY